MTVLPAQPRLPHPRGSGGGTVVVVVMVLLAAALGGFAVWFQWRQTRRCLAFYGPRVAGSVRAAARVELWTLSSSRNGSLRRARCQDVTTAPGLVHLRHGLLEDANFDWADTGGAALPTTAWDFAFAFFDSPASATPEAVLAIDLDGSPGAITVVGRPGRAGLGRLANGLRTWISAREGAGESGSAAGKSAFLAAGR